MVANQGSEGTLKMRAGTFVDLLRNNIVSQNASPQQALTIIKTVLGRDALTAARNAVSIKGTVLAGQVTKTGPISEAIEQAYGAEPGSVRAVLDAEAAVTRAKERAEDIGEDLNPRDPRDADKIAKIENRLAGAQAALAQAEAQFR